MNLKKKQNKRTGHIILFALVLCTLFLMIIPLYRISYNSMKNKIYQQTRLQNEKLSRIIDIEVLTMHSMKAELVSDQRYTMIKNLDRFDSSAQYMILKNFSDMFMSRAKMMPINDYTCIFFKNNNIAVSKDIIFDDISKSFNQYIDMDGKNYEAFRKDIFSKNSEQSVRYVENMTLNGEKSPAIIITCPIEQHINSQPDAVMFMVYKVDALFSEFGEDYKKIFNYISINDDIIYEKDKKDNGEMIVTLCSKIDLRLTMSISKEYFKAYMADFIHFIYVYVIALCLFAIIIEIIITWYMKRPIRNMAHLIADIIDDGELNNEKDIIDALYKISENKKDYEKTFLNTLFFKPLDSDECEFIYKKYPDFPKNYMFSVLYGENINEDIIKLMLNKYGIASNFVLSPRINECVAFFEYSDNVDIKGIHAALDKMVFEAKKREVMITALISIPCSSLTDFYNMYKRIQSYFRFIDYDGVFAMDRSSNSSKSNDELIIRSSEKLYSLITSGNAFEAKQLVYEQWYSVMTSNVMSDSIIERVFYSQVGVLSDVAIKVHYQGEIVKYNQKMKINELAFSIGDDIDSICELINSREKSNSEYSQVIEYIDDNFTLISFGIPDVEDKFKITGKTINKIVKSKTGKTFSEYVENHRIELAKQLIDEGGCDIKAVSEKCGFQNYDTFYKFFKKHTDMAPAKWRAARIIEHEFEKNN